MSKIKDHSDKIQYAEMEKMNDAISERIKTQHTPTPWQRQGFDVLSHGPNGTHAYFLARCQPDNGKGVVRIDTEAEAVANAAFIVRAVNSHEALLKEVKNYRDEAVRRYEVPLEKYLNNLIAKAEGK